MNYSAKPKISIIIPIYNVEKYIRQTLASVVNQTLREIEILCVDDCSTDNSREIVETVAKEDSRLTLIQQPENRGAGLARKKAIGLAAGEYILFLDGDDYLEPAACRDLYEQMTESKVDILQFGTEVVPSGNVTEAEVTELNRLFIPSEEIIEVETGGQLTDCCFRQRKFGFTLWNKIYRAEIVKTAAKYYADERFNIAEDLYLFFLISFFAASYKGVKEKYYNYRFGAGITGGKRTLTDRRFLDKVKQGDILGHIREFAGKMDPRGKLEESLRVLQDRFLSDVVWNWIWDGDALNRGWALDRVFQCFDKQATLCKLAEYYFTADILKKNTIVAGCKQATALSSKKTDIRTIGTYYFRIGNGGVERVMAKLMEIWIQLGYEVVLFTDELPSTEDYPIPDTVKRVVLPAVTDASPDQIRQRMDATMKCLSQYSVDVMVYHAWIWEYLPLDLWTAKTLGIPFVVHTHSFLGQGLKSGQAADAGHTLFIHTLYELCDGVIALSQMDYAWLCARDLKAFRTLNPLHFALSSVKPAALCTKNILWVGRISWEKQPVEALKILQEVLAAGEDAKLQILGKADDKQLEEHLREAIQSMDLENHVELLGFHADVTPFYENACVYLCTSEYEGFLMALAESKAFGVPAVVYDLPNLDMVQDGMGMKVVAQRDSHGAAEEIVSLLRDEKKRREMGREARESIEQMYSFDIPALWKRVFDTVCSREEYHSDDVDLGQLKRAIGMMMSFTAKGIALREEERRFWKSQYEYARRDYDLLASQRAIVPMSDEFASFSPAVVIDAREKVKLMFRSGDIAFRYIIRYVFAWLGFKWDKIRGKAKTQ